MDTGGRNPNLKEISNRPENKKLEQMQRIIHLASNFIVGPYSLWRPPDASPVLACSWKDILQAVYLINWSKTIPSIKKKKRKSREFLDKSSCALQFRGNQITMQSCNVHQTFPRCGTTILSLSNNSNIIRCGPLLRIFLSDMRKHTYLKSFYFFIFYFYRL